MQRYCNEDTELNEKTQIDQTLIDPDSDRPRSTSKVSGLINGKFNIGDRLLDDFEVLQFLGKGGAGVVYLVKRLSLGDLFAAKVPIRDVMSRDRTRKLFFREVRTWIGLPVHRHLTACRFVRTRDHRIVIFTEYVDGGTLADWISGKKLLQVETILDVAIQMAWGLAAAHSCCVVHQDVKPANVLMSSSGVVKITDFGLSRAFQAIDDLESTEEERNTKNSSTDTRTASVSSGVLTPMFCSPEQSDRKQVDYRTDIWSWGVTVMSMFTGPARWISGTVAASILEGYLKRGTPDPFPDIPIPVAEVLRKCFQLNPEDRWESLEEAADCLKKIYREITGKNYPGEKPEIVSNQEFRGTLRSVDNLKRAFDVLGRDTEELELLTENTNKTYKAHVLHRLELYHEIGLQLAKLNVSDRSEIRHLLIELMLEKCECHRLIADLNGVLSIIQQLFDLYEVIPEDVLEEKDYHHLGCMYFEKGIVSMSRREFNDALNMYQKAMGIWRGIAEKTQEEKYWLAVANAHNACGVIFYSLGEMSRALESQNESIGILKKTVNINPSEKIRIKLAGCLTNKAAFMSHLGKEKESIDGYQESLNIFQKLYDEGRQDVKRHLGMNYMNIASSMYRVNEYEEAVLNSSEAIAIMEELLHEQGDLSVRLFLARNYMNKSNALQALDRYEESLSEVDKAIELIRIMIFKEGDTDLMEELISFYHSKAMTWQRMGQLEKSADLLMKALELLDKPEGEKKQDYYREIETWVTVGLAGVLKEAGDTQGAENHLKRVIKVIDEKNVCFSAHHIEYLAEALRDYLEIMKSNYGDETACRVGDELKARIKSFKGVMADEMIKTLISALAC